MLTQTKSNAKNLKLSQKLFVLVLMLFLGTIGVSGVALASIFNRNAENEITAKALILITNMTSVMQYTSSQVNPVLEENLSTEFLPEAIPSYSAQQVFENFRSFPEYNEFSYKSATLNPSNLRDKADSFETKIVEQFRSDKNLTELSGFRDTPRGKLFYIAQPSIVTKPSCLKCHSVPEVAPQSMIDYYGSENGFGWQLNEIVGTKIVYVPANQVFVRTRDSFFKLLAMIIVVFAITLGWLKFWLNRYFSTL